MKQIKKTLSIFFVSIFIITGGLVNVTAKAEVDQTVPTISYVGLGHTLVAGDTRTFTVTSANYVGNVKYRAFISYDNHDKWTEITNGYTVATDARTPFVLPSTKPFELGNYKLSVWVKKAEQNGVQINMNGLGSYDSYNVSEISCTNTIGATISNSNVVGGETPSPVEGYTEKIYSNFKL